MTPLPDGGVRLTPYDPEFTQAVSALMDEYADTLGALAN